MHKKTAILFFARTPHEEAKAKAWTKSIKKNILLAKKLYNRNAKIAKSCGLPVFGSTEKQQRGVGFAERITNSIHDAFASGFDHLIVIGSDSPNLRKEDILSALNQIRLGRNTIGQTIDGGAYLFTISKSEFNHTDFKALKWCSSQLYQDLYSYLESRNDRPFILQVKIDVDHDFRGLAFFLNKIGSSIRGILFELIFRPSCFFRTTLTKKYGPFLTKVNRGPPLIIPAI